MRSPLDTYDVYLRLQAEASFRKEQSTFNFEGFRDAETVLDLGCGNGRYATLLALAYPDKQILGMDPDKDLLGRASVSSRPRNLEFVHGSYESLPDDYRPDVMVCRLVTMYIPEPQHLARWAADRVGHVVSIDAADELFLAHPAMPLFGDTEQKNAERIAKMGGDRSVTDRIPEIWEAAGFQLRSESEILVQSEAEVTKAEMHHLVYLHAELATGQPLSADLQDEIFSWSIENQSYLQYGLRARVFSSTRSAVGS